HRDGRGAILVAAVSEGAGAIVPPAERATLGRQSARVQPPRGYRDQPEVPGQVRRSRLRRVGPDAELSEAVVSPAGHHLIQPDRTGVEATGWDGGEASLAGNGGRHEPILLRAVAELPELVEAPAARAAAVDDAAGVDVPCFERGEPQLGGDRRGGGTVGGRAVAQLAEAVVAPTVGDSGQVQRAGV